MKVSEYRPLGFWRLDGTSPHTDYSGYGQTATQAGTQVKGIALTSNTAYSQLLTTSNVITFPSSVYQSGSRQDRPFSLMATIYPSTGTTASEQQVLSRNAARDGITINGTVVQFKTNYSSAGSAVCEYDIEYPHKIDVVGVHTPMKNSLYVNGKLVDEVDITSDQQQDTYATVANNNLYSGTSTSNQRMLINNVGIFGHDLTGEQIAALHADNNRVAVGDVPKIFNGTSIVLSAQGRIPYLTEPAVWQSGVFSGCSQDGTQLVADIVAGYTVAGTWMDSFRLMQGETPVSVSSVAVYFSGKNVTVQTSIDGITWTNAVYGAPVASVTSGTLALHVRVLFTAGQEEAHLDELFIREYISNSYIIPNSRTITYAGSMRMFDEYEPRELSDRWGVHLNGGTLTIAADPNIQPKVVEIWVKQGTGTTLTRNFSGSASWVNGVSSSILPVGEWAVFHVRTVAQPYTGDLTFSGDAQIGQVAIYPDDISTSIPTIVKLYTGVPTTTVTENSTVTVSEPTEAATVYVHDWEIVAS